MGFSGGSDGKASSCNAGDPGLILGSGRPPEKEMATHFSNLAWKIPWTKEPGRLQSMGSQSVRHDGATFTFFSGFPGDSDGKQSACNAGDLVSIPGLGRSPGEGNGYPLHILA